MQRATRAAEIVNRAAVMVMRVHLRVRRTVVMNVRRGHVRTRLCRSRRDDAGELRNDEGRYQQADQDAGYRAEPLHVTAAAIPQ